MTEQVNEIESNEALELKMLMERATQLGIPYKGNIGIDTLRDRVANKLEGNKNDKYTDVDVEEDGADEVAPRPETEQELRERITAEATRLVRCRIYNLNPGKRDLPGEFATVANRYMGTITKFIPFGEATDNGYHIPNVIYEDLKTRKFQHLTEKKVPGQPGQTELVRRLVPEYQIEIMEPLTAEELGELAINQAAADRLNT